MEKPEHNGSEDEQSKKTLVFAPARLKLSSFRSSESASMSSTHKLVLRPSILAAQTEKLKSQNTEVFKLISDRTDPSIKNGNNDESSHSVNSNQSSVKKDAALQPSTSASTSETVTLKCAQQVASPEPASFGLFSTNSKETSPDTGGFVFGQNLHERASYYDPNKSNKPHLEPLSTDLTFESVKKEDEPQKEETEQKCGLKRTLSDAAKEYESKKVKAMLEEVSVITGEEGEYNVLQINCKLFYFDKEKRNYHERGRGLLRLNDKEADGCIHSRVVMRTQGSLRVILNTKIWAGMSVEHASEKTIRMTALDSDGLKVFLIMSSAKDSDLLYSALKYRITGLKSREDTMKNCGVNDSSIDESASLSSNLDISSNDSFPDCSRHGFGKLETDVEAATESITSNYQSSETVPTVDTSVASSDIPDD